ncbi:LOW QUALITY PROTEIN: Leucine-rich repeat serine/threonine-protein kinase 2, partial [Galemys pyrenaicus]
PPAAGRGGRQSGGRGGAGRGGAGGRSRQPAAARRPPPLGAGGRGGMAGLGARGRAEERERLRRLLERLRGVQAGRRVDTLVQTLEDVLLLTYADHAAELFRGRDAHGPLLVVLDAYLSVAGVQQVGWSLLCRLLEVCPGTAQGLAAPPDVGRDWEVLGVHQLILKMLAAHGASADLCVVGLKALDLLLASGKLALLILDEESDVFLLILSAMRNFPASDEVQKLGCRALHVLFERGVRRGGGGQSGRGLRTPPRAGRGLSQGRGAWSQAGFSGLWPLTPARMGSWVPAELGMLGWVSRERCACRTQQGRLWSGQGLQSMAGISGVQLAPAFPGSGRVPLPAPVALGGDPWGAETRAAAASGWDPPSWDAAPHRMLPRGPRRVDRLLCPLGEAGDAPRRGRPFWLSGRRPWHSRRASLAVSLGRLYTVGCPLPTPLRAGHPVALPFSLEYPKETKTLGPPAESSSGLHHCLPVSEEQLVEFVESRDHEVLLEALQLFGSNVEVLMSGSVRCYKVVLAAMAAFPGHEGVQEVSCRLLHRLALGNFFNILVLHEVPASVLRAARRFPGNAALQVAALRCLALLTETIFLNRDLEERCEDGGPEAQAQGERPFWLDACHRALAGHRKDVHVQEAACWALQNLLAHQRSLHLHIGDEDGQFPAHRAVMLSMLMHASSPGVCQAAAGALSALLQQNASFRKSLLAKGIHLNVLELVQKHAHCPEVAASSCRLMSQLFEGSDASLDTVTAVATKIIMVMRSHEAELPVQLEAAGAILQFLAPGAPEPSGGGRCELDAVRALCWRSGLHTLVLAALSRFPEHPGVQKLGLQALSALALLPEAAETLRLEGAVDTLLPSLQEHPHDAEIQCLGLRLIGRLATRTSLCSGTGPLLAGVLASNLRRFEGLADVQTRVRGAPAVHGGPSGPAALLPGVSSVCLCLVTEGLLPSGLLQVLTRLRAVGAACVPTPDRRAPLCPAALLSHPDFQGFQTALRTLELWAPFSRLLLQQAFDELLFQRLSAGLPEQMDPQLLELCCKCLARLAAEDELKGAMLRRACEQDNSVMAECLLLLGADVELAQAQGAPALICQVSPLGRAPRALRVPGQGRPAAGPALRGPGSLTDRLCGGSPARPGAQGPPSGQKQPQERVLPAHHPLCFGPEALRVPAAAAGGAPSAAPPARAGRPGAARRGHGVCFREGGHVRTGVSSLRSPAAALQAVSLLGARTLILVSAGSPPAAGRCLRLLGARVGGRVLTRAPLRVEQPSGQLGAGVGGSGPRPARRRNPESQVRGLLLGLVRAQRPALAWRGGRLSAPGRRERAGRGACASTGLLPRPRLLSPPREGSPRLPRPTRRLPSRQVCEEAHSPRLLELLLRQGPREQDVRAALDLSVRRGDGTAVGLLLRRLGLDRAHGGLCLGGLRLRRVEPAWLAPLFPDPDQTPDLRRQSGECAEGRRRKSPGGEQGCAGPRAPALMPPLPAGAGSTLARMVLRQQRSRAGAGAAASGDEGGEGGPTEEALDQQDEWTLVPEAPVDSVFSQSDDPDSEVRLCALGGSLRSPPPLPAASEESVESGGESLSRQGPVQDQDSREGRGSVLSADDPLRDSSLSSPPVETGRITSLDLSANELQDIAALARSAGLSAHLEHLERLELHQNALASFPPALCGVLRRLRHLDLHGNKLTSFPAHVLGLPRLAVLDVSRNHIGPRALLDAAVPCPTLRQLSLAHNQLDCVPEDLGAVAGGLEQLALEGNEISGTCPRLCLKELRALNLSRNRISGLAGGFLDACPGVESFSARTNLLASLPALPPSLTNVKLAQNRFTCVPDALLGLPHLRALDMSSNEIQSLPGPTHWRSQNLRELLFSHNRISVLDLSEQTCAWARLEKLHLAHNRLRELPPEIGCLQNLTSLDVSHNVELRSLPNEMGKLSKMWDLPLDELRLDFDLRRIGGKAKDVIRFLQQRLRQAMPYSRLKLLVLGDAGSGKSTLLRQLTRAGRAEAGAPGPTVGIDVKDWPVRGRGKGARDLVLNVWDFTGREELHSVHAHFLTPRALYLVVFDLSKGPAALDSVKPWLFNARAPVSPVVLVGTHLDACDESQRQACVARATRELLGQRGLPAVRSCHFVNATQESDALAKLRKAIVRESLDFKIRAEPVVGQLVPACYLGLERIVLAERKSAPADFPVVSRQRLLQLVREQQLPLDESELAQAVHFLSESGILLHFQDPALQLSDLHFLEPSWLCAALAQVGVPGAVLTVTAEAGRKHPQGVVARRDVEKFLTKRRCFPRRHLPQYFRLLEGLQLALPLGEDLLLVPGSLPSHTPVIELPHCENSEVIVRLYEAPCFPLGFWPRLIHRILEVSPYMLSGREHALRPNRMYWRRGVHLSWSSEAYCLMGAEAPAGRPQSCLRVTVPSSRKGRILLGQAVDHIDALLEEWFPGLLETDVCGDGETLLKKWALHGFQDGQEPRRVLLDDLAREAEQGDLLVSRGQPRLTVPIAQVAPDLTLDDLPGRVLLRREALELQQAPEFLLGDGSFGSVYRARYDGAEAAVKIFHKHTPLRLLRQELAVLCHLHHPSLVSLLAASARPRMLVMELAGQGSLDRLLEQGPAGLPRALQHRVALHVADGLRYLHSATIVYRDLKPHNVLLFTLQPGAPVLAKIADYGIAQHCCRMGVRTSEGTPGFRAPEVAKGNVVYNQLADVYSLGLLLYDILTAGRRIAEGLKFPNEFDEVAVQGKLPDPVGEYGCAPWPGIQQLIRRCLQENPQDRPTSAQVYDSLTAAELLCLRSHVPLPRDPQAECVAAGSLGGGARVWLGCRGAGGGQLTSLDLHSEALSSQRSPHAVSLQEVADSSVLCLALVPLPADQDVWVVCGTQSGALVAVSAQAGGRRHALERMADAVTCMCCQALRGQSRQSSFLLAGTAGGRLAIFEDRAVKSPGAAPLRMVTLGDACAPLLCLSEPAGPAERSLVWGGCGASVFSLGPDFSVQTLIDTRAGQLFSHGASGEGNITAVVGDTLLFVAKQSSPLVEVWDPRTRRLSRLVDCARLLREDAAPGSEDRPAAARAARVKTLCLQRDSALWVGTGGGCILLLDLSTHRLIRVIRGFYDSVRGMVTAQLGKSSPLSGPLCLLKMFIFTFLHRSFKNVVLVLGYAQKSPDGSQQQEEPPRPCVSVWDVGLPHEVQNLEQHIQARAQLAAKMRAAPLD